MICPDCNGAIRIIDCKGTLVDECSKCKGKWFDRGVLRDAKDLQDDHLRWLDFDPFGEDAEQLSVPSEGKLCPKCLKKMSSLNYKNSGIIIDKCSFCQGVWLNYGEFRKIIEYLENLVTTQTVKGYTKDSFKQFIEIFKGPEGVVSEVKDFLAVFYLLQLRIATEHPELSKAAQKIYKYIPFK
ncbi:zf-TFIIB domain-containing protein [Thermoproteota archaeon]